MQPIFAVAFAAIFAAVISLADIMANLFGTVFGFLAIGGWMMGIWLVVVVGPLVLGLFLKKKSKIKGIDWGKNSMHLIAFVGFTTIFLLIPIIFTPMIYVQGQIGGRSIAQIAWPTVEEHPGGTKPLTQAHIVVQLQNELEQRSTGVKDLTGTVGLYKVDALHPVGNLDFQETVTIAAGTGTSTGFYDSGEQFYCLLTSGGVSTWVGPKTLPEVDKDDQVTTTHSLKLKMVPYNTTGFAGAWANGTVVIGNYGEYNGTDSGDYPELKFTLSYTETNLGFLVFSDPSILYKGLPVQRDHYVVVKVNNTGTDGIQITPDSKIVSSWTLVRQNTDEKWYVFNVGSLYKSVDANNRPVLSGDISFLFDYDISSLTAGQSVRFGWYEYIGAPWQYYATNGGHYSGATLVASGCIYLQA
jgi:hypothetical protein